MSDELELKKPHYESHITFLGNKHLIKTLVEGHKWKFSCIDGDPILGDGVKCYATKQFNLRKGELRIINELNEIANDITKRFGDDVKVIRKKIEKVVYDMRPKDHNCDGACVECHME